MAFHFAKINIFKKCEIELKMQKRRRIAHHYRQQSLTNNNEQSFLERVSRLSLFLTLGDGVSGPFWIIGFLV